MDLPKTKENALNQWKREITRTTFDSFWLIAFFKLFNYLPQCGKKMTRPRSRSYVLNQLFELATELEETKSLE